MIYELQFICWQLLPAAIILAMDYMQYCTNKGSGLGAGPIPLWVRKMKGYVAENTDLQQTDVMYTPFCVAH